MPIRIFENVTPKYCNLHTNILVIFNLLPFIVILIELVTLEQLYLAYEKEQSQGYNIRTTCSFTKFSSNKNVRFFVK